MLVLAQQRRRVKSQAGHALIYTLHTASLRRAWDTGGHKHDLASRLCLLFAKVLSPLHGSSASIFVFQQGGTFKRGETLAII